MRRVGFGCEDSRLRASSEKGLLGKSATAWRLGDLGSFGLRFQGTPDVGLRGCRLFGQGDGSASKGFSGFRWLPVSEFTNVMGFRLVLTQNKEASSREYGTWALG